MSERRDLSFDSDDGRCAAWHYAGDGDAFAGERGRPCVVMAHGYGATRDSGLEPFAERFAAAGLDALLFDYRNFGASPGEPRQLVSWRRHRRDYRAALACARGLPGVDPDRVVLWGSSYAGGHVIAVAADEPDVAAVISQVPAADGLAAVLEIGRYAGVGQLARLTLAGLRDLASSALGRGPRMIPTVGPPGSLGAMTTEDAEPGYRAIAGPTWRNEVCARAALDAALNRPLQRAGEVSCPLLVQVAEFDTICPPDSAREAAWRARERGRPEVRNYPLGHFDVYRGEAFERVVGDQLHFLRRHVAPAVTEPAALAPPR